MLPISYVLIVNNDFMVPCFMLQHENIFECLILFPWHALGSRQMAVQTDIRDNEDSNREWESRDQL